MPGCCPRGMATAAGSCRRSKRPSATNGFRVRRFPCAGACAGTVDMAIGSARLTLLGEPVTDTDADHLTAELAEQVKSYLSDAHAIEEQALAQLRSAPKFA